MMHRVFLPIAAAVLAASPAIAHEYKTNGINVMHPWARASAPGQKVGGAYMHIQNTSTTADRLLSVSSPAADKVEIHEMKMDGDIMRMREIQTGLSIAPKGGVSLKPGSYHLMLQGLKAPLKRGALVPLTLNFERAGAINIKLKVEPIDHGGSNHEHH